ncbi:MAG: hypothetical protein VB853_10830, partial [Pirellulales bacterium]
SGSHPAQLTRTNCDWIKEILQVSSLKGNSRQCQFITPQMGYVLFPDDLPNLLYTGGSSSADDRGRAATMTEPGPNRHLTTWGMYPQQLHRQAGGKTRGSHKPPGNWGIVKGIFHQYSVYTGAASRL